MKPTNEPKKPFFKVLLSLRFLEGFYSFFFYALSILMAVFRTIS